MGGRCSIPFRFYFTLGLLHTHIDLILDLLRTHFKSISLPQRFFFGRHTIACRDDVDVIVGSHRTHVGFNFTLVSLRVHFELIEFTFNFTSISLQFHCEFTAMSLRIHCDPISKALRNHFDFISISLRFHLDSTSISLRIHFGFTSSSVLGFTSNSLRCHVGVTRHFDFTSNGFRIDFYVTSISLRLKIQEKPGFGV